MTLPLLRFLAKPVAVLVIACVALAGLPASATEKALALIQALNLKEVVEVMQDEGLAYGNDLEAQMFPGKGGKSWSDSVKGIYAVDRILPNFSTAFEAALDQGGGDVDAMLAFVQSDLGHRAVTLEVSARQALLDQAVEDAAKVKLGQMQASDDPRLAAIKNFVVTNNLIESNVTGGLNANLAFYKGLATAGGLAQPMSEEDMLSEVWSQEASLRADTEEWLYSFMALAYAPLTDAELQAYTDFSASKPGRDMNRAMFAAFDLVFVDVSGRLGHAAAQHVAGQNL